MNYYTFVLFSILKLELHLEQVCDWFGESECFGLVTSGISQVQFLAYLILFVSTIDLVIEYMIFVLETILQCKPLTQLGLRPPPPPPKQPLLSPSLHFKPCVQEGPLLVVEKGKYGIKLFWLQLIHYIEESPLLI